MFAVTFLDHIAERVVVSFKGTDPRNIWNWVVDLNALRMVYPPANNSTTYVHVRRRVEFWNFYLLFAFRRECNVLRCRLTALGFVFRLASIKPMRRCSPALPTPCVWAWAGFRFIRCT